MSRAQEIPASPTRGGKASAAVDFRGLTKACASCHKDPHEGKLGTACESCHGNDTFRVAKFKHPKNAELYGGQHATVACSKCHGGEGVAKSGVTGKPVAARLYRGLSSDCASCHKDVHLGQLGSNCQTCHSVEAPKFAADRFKHATTAFALTGKHEKVECGKCHKRETTVFPAGTGEAVHFKGVGTACASCHKDVHLGQLGSRCESCHTSESFKLATYKHKENPDFFVAKHFTTRCQDCHKSVEADFPSGHGKAVQYAKLTTACANCHEDVHRGTLGTRCESCHEPHRWPGASRAFHKATLFPLEGQHQRVACESCHLNGQIKGTPNRCYDCHWIRHQDDRFRTKLGTDCENCHRTTSWQSVNWNHGAATGFTLAGAHAVIACESCHINQDFSASTPLDCYNCHRQDFQAAKVPPHVSAGFPTTCTTCHKFADTSWHQAKFDHSATAFPLLGVHATQLCSACHADGVYKGKPTACVSCHQTDFNNSKNPNHAAAGFSTTCDSCHKVSDPSWKQGTFNHAATAFPLLGVHATQACSACHSDNVFKGKPTTCVSCHMTDFNNSKNPSHTAAGFATTCDTCHKISDPSWAQGTFNHATTLFPLLGVHATQACSVCHGDNVFKGKPTTCVSCHLTDFNNSKNPSHTAAGFPTTCDTCHKVSDPSWQQGTFNHAGTGFALVGVHATQACNACHTGGTFTNIPTTCVSCHLAKFNATTNPSHSAAGFSTTCDTCHKATDPDWTLGTFNHAATLFPLTGAHATQACKACHGDNVFKGKTTACVGCHQADYNATTNPPHAAAGFPTTCDSCHKVSDTLWTQATFNHSIFPLAGVHATTACANCHANNNFGTTLPTTCVGCHLSNYQGATTPVNHAGLPTTCDSCHKFTDATWALATTFNHATYFPLAGAHTTTNCTNCHTNGNFTTVPTSPCYACHATDFQNAITPVNHVASGFPTTCDTCHKFTDTSWTQATFNHSSVFPLSGVHATTPCANCHVNNNYTTVPTTCVGCHLATYQGATTPVNHAGMPTTCDSCHGFADAAWTLASTFNHTTYFALAGAHTTAACTSCHINGNFTTVPTSPCYACHATDYQNAITPVNHVALGFPTTCDTCHHFSDTSWTQGTFNHSIFPLQGVHATTPCASCHINNNYTTVPTTCVGCHLTDYQGATTPVNHAGLPTTCTSCHAFTDPLWTTASTFNHATYFALAGAHTTATCTSCHTNGNFTTVPTGPCYACHATDYQNAITPVNHVALGFPTTCDTCHHFSDTSWTQGTFNHSIFPLQGVHATTPCANCHINNNYTTVPTTCVGCHLTDFQNATTPVNHAGMPTTCANCHGFADPLFTTASTFNHATYFPLAGAHTTTACTNCHTNGNFTTVPTGPCYACHATDYQNAITPINHVALGFPTTCDTCHHFSDTSWTQGTFNHSIFPLAGVHATTPCASCHINNNYTTVPTTCVGCHLTDYQGATTPVNHAGMPTTCADCHGFADPLFTTASTFNHQTYFALAGAHSTTACTNCHTNGNFTTVPTGPCYACHATDYANAITPVNHIAAGFPTTCDTCHHYSDTSWTQGTFNHTWFPQNHGNSGGVCSVCHTDPTNYAVFSCTTGCHPQSQTNNDHQGVSGYVYLSSACYACHPNGHGGAPVRRILGGVVRSHK